MKISSKSCKKCGNPVTHTTSFIVDDHIICKNCLYGNVKPFEIYPIGFVENKLKREQNGFGVIGDKDISVINMMQSQLKFMFKLEEEKYITVVYYLHKSRAVKSVFRRGLDGKQVGVFVSRTPDRLSGIGIQDVEVIKIERNKIFVKGLDAINGTPVLDIKLKI